MKKLQAFFESRPKSRIADVGTGSGQFIHIIQSVDQDYAEIIGIDLSERALEVARKQFADDARISFQKMDATEMAFADQSFDIVCLSNSLHHLPDVAKAIHEMKRIVKPEGVLLFVEMRSDSLTPQQLSHRMLHHFGAKIDRECGIEHRDTYSEKEILDLVSGSGLKILDAWGAVEEQRYEPTPEDCEQLIQSLDRQLARIIDPDRKSVLAEEAEQIKQYIRKNRFDSATEIIVLAQK